LKPEKPKTEIAGKNYCQQDFSFRLSTDLMPNGWRYPLVGGTRKRHFDGINFKPYKLPENAPTPTSRVHAVLGGDLCLGAFLWSDTITSTLI